MDGGQKEKGESKDAAAAEKGKENEEAAAVSLSLEEISYVSYAGEHHLPLIMDIVDRELSEPYSIFTYRYFVYLWPQLCFLAFHGGRCIGTIVCKMGEHRNTFRGYIAMLVVIKPYRGNGIATELVTLEAEVTNKGALALYGRLGFIRAKRLYRYYLNGVDAFRLKLLFPQPELDPLLMLNEANYSGEAGKESIQQGHQQHHCHGNCEHHGDEPSLASK